MVGEGSRRLHQELLVAVVVGDMREQLHGWFRRAEERDARALEQQARLAHLLFTHPAGDQRFVGFLREFDDDAGHLGRIGHRLRRQDDQHAIDIAVFEAGFEGHGVAGRVGVPDDVERIRIGPGRRQVLVEFLARGRIERSQRHADVGGIVGGHHARSAAVGDDREPVAARMEVRE